MFLEYCKSYQNVRIIFCTIIYLYSHFPTIGLVSNDFPDGSLAVWAIGAVLQSFVDAASTENMATFGLHRVFEARETYRALICKPSTLKHILYFDKLTRVFLGL